MGNRLMLALVDDSNKALILLVEVTKEYLTIEAKVIVYATASCSFEFSVYDSVDKDHVPIGRASDTTEFEFDTEILITLTGDFINQPEKVEVLTLELLSYPAHADFGEINPD